MNFLVWIIFGALVGWIASMIMGTNQQQGALANIAVGVVGAVLGGWLVEAFGGQGVTGFNWRSFFVALLGAVILLGLLKLLTGRKQS